MAFVPAAGLVLEKGERGMLIPSLTPTNAPKEASFPLQTSIFITHPYHPHPPHLQGTPDSFPSALACFPLQEPP